LDECQWLAAKSLRAEGDDESSGGLSSVSDVCVRPATPGELIEFIVGGRVDTVTVARPGDMVVRSSGARDAAVSSAAQHVDEQEVMSEAKFARRYRLVVVNGGTVDCRGQKREAPNPSTALTGKKHRPLDRQKEDGEVEDAELVSCSIR
jgi:hypothetical protein